MTLELLALETATIKGRTFEALRKLMLAKASRPLLVVIEDAHWIDRTSEEFLTELVDEMPSVPVLLLATYRPGYNPPWLGKSFVTQIALRPLSGRPANASSQQSSARRAMRPRGSSVGARETPSSSRNSLEPHDSRPTAAPMARSRRPCRTS